MVLIRFIIRISIIRILIRIMRTYYLIHLILLVIGLILEVLMVIFTWIFIIEVEEEGSQLFLVIILLELFLILSFREDLECWDRVR